MGQFAKFAGAAGAALALIDALINTGDPKHERVLQEFDKVHQSFTGLESSLAELKDDITEHLSYIDVKANMDKLYSPRRIYRAYLEKPNDRTRIEEVKAFFAGDYLPQMIHDVQVDFFLH